MKIIVDENRFNITAEIKEGCDVYSATELISVLLEMEGYNHDGVEKAVELARSKRYYGGLGMVCDNKTEE